MLQGVAPFALAQSKDLLFRRFQDLSRRTYLLLDHLRNIRRSICKTTQHGLFPDDIGIPHSVGSRGCDLHQLHNVITGIVVIYAQLPHLVQHGDRVNGLGEVEHRIDGLVDLPVLLLIEICRLHNAHDLRQTAAVDQDRAQHRLFRLNGMGHLSNNQFFIHGGLPLSWLI